MNRVGLIRVLSFVVMLTTMFMLTSVAWAQEEEAVSATSQHILLAVAVIVVAGFVVYRARAKKHREELKKFMETMKEE